MNSLLSRFASAQSTTGYGVTILVRSDGRVWLKQLTDLPFIPLALPLPVIYADCLEGGVMMVTVTGDLYIYLYGKLEHHPCDKPLVSVTTGMSNLLLAADGTVFTVVDGDIVVLPLSGPVKQTTIGDNLGCLLLTDGRVMAWSIWGDIRDAVFLDISQVESAYSANRHCLLVMVDGRVMWFPENLIPGCLKLPVPVRFASDVEDGIIAVDREDQVFLSRHGRIEYLKLPGRVHSVSIGSFQLITLKDGRVFTLDQLQPIILTELTLPV